MNKHYLSYSAVLLMLFRQHGGDAPNNGKANEVLLQLRQGTGFMDGMWDMAASGHVDEGEPMSSAVIREAYEELGIIIRQHEIEFACMLHRYGPDPGRAYYSGYFTAKSFEGTIQIAEPDKCAKLQWFSVDGLPDNLIPDRKLAIELYLSNIPYGEYGWNDTR